MAEAGATFNNRIENVGQLFQADSLIYNAAAEPSQAPLFALLRQIDRGYQLEQLAEAIPHYQERARVKPGLTGWAQVNFPYGASVEDARVKLSYDLYYVKHRGVLLDLAILFSTVRVILFQEGSR